MTIDKVWKGKYKGDSFKYYKKGMRYNYRYPKSDYYENRVWGALHKAWLGYTIACNKWDEFDKKREYALIIRNIQRQLRLEQSKFECLN